MPTQRIIKSPLINGINEIKSLQKHYLDIKELPIKEKEVFTPICKPNTLILAFHHIFHRKLQLIKKEKDL